MKKRRVVSGLVVVLFVILLAGVVYAEKIGLDIENNYVKSGDIDFKITLYDDEIVDAVGELTNMICGGAKAQLSKLNQKFDLATPTMITGKGVEIAYYTEAPIIVIPFETANGSFVVEANLGEKID